MSFTAWWLRGGARFLVVVDIVIDGICVFDVIDAKDVLLSNVK